MIRSGHFCSLSFAFGSAATFTLLGVIASVTRGLIGIPTKWRYFSLGFLMVLMALQVWDIFEVIPSSYLASRNRVRGYFGAFITGILSGIFSSPCSTPVLIVLLAIIAGKGSVVWGTWLLLIYSVDHGILAVIAGTSIGFVQRLSLNEKYNRVAKVLKVMMGGVILFIGFYMFYLSF